MSELNDMVGHPKIRRDLTVGDGMGLTISSSLFVNLSFDSCASKRSPSQNERLDFNKSSSIIPPPPGGPPPSPEPRETKISHTHTLRERTHQLFPEFVEFTRRHEKVCQLLRCPDRRRFLIIVWPWARVGTVTSPGDRAGDVWTRAGVAIGIVAVPVSECWTRVGDGGGVQGSEGVCSGSVG